MTSTLTALFTGDSITDMSRRTDPSGFLGAGYVRRIAELTSRAGHDLRIVNTGVGGDRTTDLLARWDRDVIAHRPDILTVLVGANDMWRRYDSGQATSAHAFEGTYSRLLDAVQSELPDTRLVLMDPFLVPITVEQLPWVQEDLLEKVACVADLATRYGATHIPLHTLMSERAARDGESSVIDDGIHPSAGGHELIAQAWMCQVLGTLPRQSIIAETAPNT